MRTLYISYDGMTDTLGQSQVMPYLSGLAAGGQEIRILSCEKRDAFKKEEASVRTRLERARLGWRPVFYHKRPPVIAKLWDLAVMEQQAIAMHREWSYQTVHCRSYLAALVGARLKRKLGVKFIFDMRGFWADERLDGGLWRQSSPVYGPIYAWFKRKERELLTEADAVVCLTEAAVAQIERWGLGAVARKAVVVPCCADLALFSPEAVDTQARAAKRRELGLDEAAPVLVYLGSLGTWYGLKEMLALFKEIASRKPAAVFLFVTGEDRETVFRAADDVGVARDRLRVIFARRQDVPLYVSLGQAGVFFMKVPRSGAGFSPTKLAELLAMGLPVIFNSGIGDTDALLASTGVASSVHPLNNEGFRKTAAVLDELLAVPADRVRAVAQKHFALDEGVRRYAALYASLENGKA